MHLKTPDIYKFWKTWNISRFLFLMQVQIYKTFIWYLYICSMLNTRWDNSGVIEGKMLDLKLLAMANVAWIKWDIWIESNLCWYVQRKTYHLCWKDEKLNFTSRFNFTPTCERRNKSHVREKSPKQPYRSSNNNRRLNILFGSIWYHRPTSIHCGRQYKKAP